MQRQVRTNLPVILNKRSKDVVPIILPRSAGKPGSRIEAARLRPRCIIQEVPDVIEAIVWPSNRVV